jgi:UDPglucose 6-dehydrogenase
VAVLGLTFKPGTDDLREAPSIPNVKMLLQEGAEVVAYDPVGEDNFKKLFSEQEITYVQDPKEALKNADLAFLFTEWKEITGLKLDTYRELMKKPVIFDGRNCYSLEEAKEAGVEYYSIGRPGVK